VAQRRCFEPPPLPQTFQKNKKRKMKCTLKVDGILCDRPNNEPRFLQGEFSKYDRPICLKCAIGILVGEERKTSEEIMLLFLLREENRQHFASYCMSLKLSSEEKETDVRLYKPMRDEAIKNSTQFFMNDPALFQAHYGEQLCRK